MSLRDLTKDSHKAAEKTKFMQAIFKGNMPKGIWADYTYNKMLWYGAIEVRARAAGLLDNLPGIERSLRLYEDAKEMDPKLVCGPLKSITRSYTRYILDLDGAERVLAHLYVWHMGDLHGGQIIKKMLPFPHRNLEFTDPELLKTNIRAKLDDSLAYEANAAFAWAIKIMDEYHGSLV